MMNLLSWLSLSSVPLLLPLHWLARPPRFRDQTSRSAFKRTLQRQIPHYGIGRQFT